jgi:hypothetical protein
VEWHGGRYSRPCIWAGAKCEVNEFLLGMVGVLGLRAAAWCCAGGSRRIMSSAAAKKRLASSFSQETQSQRADDAACNVVLGSDSS